MGAVCPHIPMANIFMDKIKIVEADLNNGEHQRAIVEMINAYACDPMGDGCRLPQEVLDNLIPGLQKHPTTLIFLALDEQAPVGAAICFVGFSTFSARPLINIHDLSVIASHRGRKIGRRLLEAVEEKARHLGCCKVTLEVREDNGSAETLYRKMGFGDLAIEESRDVRMLFLQKKIIRSQQP